MGNVFLEVVVSGVGVGMGFVFFLYVLCCFEYYFYRVGLVGLFMLVFFRRGFGGLEINVVEMFVFLGVYSVF